ncbi:MAG TPA: RDD family protein, partial [Kofleriaceae bacterium]|nr:RDD family protein [Kofleriaceae bacterium]
IACSFGIKLAEWVVGWELRDNDLVIWPVLIIYETLCIARWGKTIGKSLFELEVVSIHTQGKPTWKSAAVRALAMFGLQYGLMLGAVVVDMLDIMLAHEILAIATAVSFVLLGIVLAWAALRSPGKRALWDRVSGTIVRYHTQHTASPA